MIPLNERPGFAQLDALNDMGGDELDGEKFREKWNARMTLIAESGDAGIALAASHPGSRLNFNGERLAMLGRIVRRAVATAPESIVSEEIQRFREKVERDVAEATERERRKEAMEQSATERRWADDASQKNIRELIAEIEGVGIRLSLSAEGDDKIIARGGNLSQQHKVWLATRRRHVIDVLRDREHAARVAEVI